MTKKKVEVQDDQLDDVVDPEVTVEGSYPTLSRVRTELFSLDAALSHRGSLGLPLRVPIELYGYEGVGKSTLSYYLAGRVATAQGSGVTIADLEAADREYIRRAVAAGGYKGVVKLADLVEPDGKPIPHERVLMVMARDLLFERASAVIWDSVGATRPLSEMEALTAPDPKGKAMFGERHMGQGAFLATQVTEALSTALITKKTPSTAIQINHLHPRMGMLGHTTTGGQRIKYLAGVRMMVQRGDVYLLDDDDPNSLLGYLVYGKIEKLRYGGGTRKFQYFVVPGFGVHVGVTAMFDALDLGLIEAKGGRIFLDGRNLGWIKKDLLKYALDGHKRKFYPFQERVAEYARKVENGDVPLPDTATEEATDEAE